MAAPFTIDAEGLKGLDKYFQGLPAVANTSARLALNTVAERSGLKRLRQAIRAQVDFPDGYLEQGDRLFVSRKATDNDLTVVISARARATSLARFATSSAIPTPRGAGVTVNVKAGSAKHLKRAFLVRLKRGASLTEDSYNVGLAIRLKPGERIENKRTTVQLDHNVQLLYGPSVDQVFKDVAEEQAPAILEDVETEFLRQFTRLAGD